MPSGIYIRTKPRHQSLETRQIGRFLFPEEVVHHINGITNDNRINNLELFANQSDHLIHHSKERRN